MKLIDKDALVAEIESLLDKGRYHEEYDCAYRDGNNDALDALKGKLNTLEVKEVDLEHLEQEVKDFCYKFDDRKDKWYDMTPHDKNIMVNPTWSNFAMQLAKHFFELGLNAQKGE